MRHFLKDFISDCRIQRFIDGPEMVQIQPQQGQMILLSGRDGNRLGQLSHEAGAGKQVCDGVAVLGMFSPLGGH